MQITFMLRKTKYKGEDTWRGLHELSKGVWNLPHIFHIYSIVKKGKVSLAGADSFLEVSKIMTRWLCFALQKVEHEKLWRWESWLVKMILGIAYTN